MATERVNPPDPDSREPDCICCDPMEPTPDCYYHGTEVEERREAQRRADARKRIDRFMELYRGGPDIIYRLPIIHGLPALGGLNWSDIESVLADADRDRQFVETVRTAFDEMQNRRNEPNSEAMSVLMAELILTASTEHKRIYGTPCTKEKA